MSTVYILCIKIYTVSTVTSLYTHLNSNMYERDSLEGMCDYCVYIGNQMNLDVVCGRIWDEQAMARCVVSGAVRSGSF